MLTDWCLLGLSVGSLPARVWVCGQGKLAYEDSTYWDTVFMGTALIGTLGLWGQHLLGHWAYGDLFCMPACKHWMGRQIIF